MDSHRLPAAGRTAGLLCLVLVAAAAMIALVPTPTPAVAEAADAGTLTGRPAVVVELFTSQGCSSCPPADRLLSRLGRADGAEVIPLSFHVDYWNYIGWTDPFSSAEWSDRQRRYAERFRLRSIYTPQVVVNGESECVGSNERQVRERIAEARSRAAEGHVEIELAPSAEGDRLELRVAAGGDDPAGRSGLEAWVALFETDLSTPVGRGENARKTLHNDYVVRRLVRAFTLADEAGAASLALDLDPGWKVENLGVAAFLQDPDSLVISNASVAYLRERS